MPSGVLAIGMSVAVTAPAPSGRSELTKARVVSFPPMANTCVSLAGCVAVQPCLRAPPPAAAPYLDSLNTQASLRPPRGESCSWVVWPCWQGDDLPLGKPALQSPVGGRIMPLTIRGFAGSMAAVIVCSALALEGCGSAFPPAPPRATSFPPGTNAQTSVIVIPIDVRVRNFRQALSRAGSSRILDSGWRAVQTASNDGYADVRTIIATYLNSKVVGSRFVPTEFRITARRGEVGESGQGDVIRIGFNERFELQLRSRAGEYVCGPQGNAALRASAAIAARVRPDGTLQSSISDFAGRLPAYCDIARSFINNGGIDLTPALREPYLRALNKVAQTVAMVIQRTFDLVVRAKFATVAQQLAQPIQISENAWLTPNLQNATIRNLSLATSGSDLLANFNLALAARPQVSLGSAAPPPSQVSVPSFSALDIPDEFRLPIDVRVPFTLMVERARSSIVGTELPIKVIGTVRINNVDIYATDAGTVTAPQPKLVIEVDFSGGASGKLYLWGTPTVDPATRVISMPDLNYTTDTSRLLIRMFAPLLTSNFVVSRVRNAATFDASKLIDEHTAPFMKPYDHTFTTSDGTTVALHAVPASVGLNGIGVDADALVVHVVVPGTLTASVDTSADALSLAR